MSEWGLWLDLFIFLADILTNWRIQPPPSPNDNDNDNNERHKSGFLFYFISFERGWPLAGTWKAPWEPGSWVGALIADHHDPGYYKPWISSSFWKKKSALSGKIIFSPDIFLLIAVPECTATGPRRVWVWWCGNPDVNMGMDRPGEVEEASGGRRVYIP